MLESDPLQANTRSVKICASASSELDACPGRNGSGNLARGYSSASATPRAEVFSAAGKPITPRNRLISCGEVQTIGVLEPPASQKVFEFPKSKFAGPPAASMLGKVLAKGKSRGSKSLPSLAFVP